MVNNSLGIRRYLTKMADLFNSFMGIAGPALAIYLAVSIVVGLIYSYLYD